MNLTRPIPALVALLLLVSPESHAQGIDLSWNNCYGPGAEFNRTFDCSGPTEQRYSLMLQFKSPVDIPNFTSFTAYLEVTGDMTMPLAPFWHYEVGGCNRTPLSGLLADATIPQSCVDACYADPWGGGLEGFAAISLYAPDFPVQGRGYLILGCFRLTPTPVEAMVNYFAARLQFSTRNRAVCAGCDQKKRITFLAADLESNDGQPVVRLTLPDKFGTCAGINNPLACADGCPPLCLLATNPCDPVPALQSTWGSLKMLYR